MWAFLSRRLATWLIIAVGAPLLGWLLGRIGDAVEARRGPNALSRGLQWTRGFLLRKRVAPRGAADPAGARDAGSPAR